MDPHSTLLSEAGRSFIKERRKSSTPSTPSMMETSLITAIHLKRQSLKISVGQRVCKVSVSLHDVVGACKVCVKPYDGGQKSQNLLSLWSVLCPQKRKKTIIWNPNLLREVDKENIHKGWNKKPTFDPGRGWSLENGSTKTTLDQRKTIVYKERYRRSNKDESSKQEEKYVRRLWEKIAKEDKEGKMNFRSV